MALNNVLLVFSREVRDQLRDRRTLFMVAVLPLLLYPLLGIGLVQMTVSFAEQERTALIYGAADLPTVPLVEQDRFLRQYFSYGDDADKLRVVTDQFLNTEPAQQDRKLREFLPLIEQVLPAINRLGEVEDELIRLRSGSDSSAELNQLEQEKDNLRTELGHWFASAPVQVLIVIPKGFGAGVEQAVQAVHADDGQAVLDILETRHPVILHNSADEKSQIAYGRVREAIRSWERVILANRLEVAGLPSTLPYPVDPRGVDLAKADEIAANIWSKIFPALLVIMSVTGAFYPAIDLGAGEKERGTMETLLISPAKRSEIVLGKFLTVMLFSISTALLNLLSMGFTGKQMLGVVGKGAGSALGDISFPPLTSLVWVLLLAIPLSALFSALSLAFAMFARSNKEGQYYLTPLLMVTMILTMFCLNPAVELTPYYSVIPVMGPALLLKSLLLTGASGGGLWVYVLPVLGSSLIYSLLALWWAIELFQSEDILFREAEKFDLGLWVRHLLREKEPTPSFSEAAVCFVLIALLQWVFLSTMQGAISENDGAQTMVVTQLVYALVTIGLPPMFMALCLTTNARQTLKLYWPGWKMLGVGIALPLALLPISLELISRLEWFFPPAPPGAERLLEAMSIGDVPVWLALLTFAIAPAVCEELAFRGFIFTGLQKSRHKWLPIVISAFLFGIIHLIPKQVFNAGLLGLVLGLLAVRSGSLIPGLVFHVLFNGVQVMMTRLPETAYDSPWAKAILEQHVVNGKTQIGASLGLLACSGLVSALLIGWLLATGNRQVFSPPAAPQPAPPIPQMGPRPTPGQASAG